MDQQPFAPRCISIDLEVGVSDSIIHSFAAVRADTGQSFEYHKGSLAAALSRLDEMADGATFLLGHNLIAFDLVHLEAANPALRLLKLPAVDTLRLNPLAFPRNPYHHLVKHYQDGRLTYGQRNNPESDARLTLDLFRDQESALRSCHETAPDLALAWHWLTTTDGVARGMNAFFTTVRRAPRPSNAEARAAIERLLAGSACVSHGHEILADAERQGWGLAYALAWMSVSGGDSVMPPWVRHQFPEAGQMVQRMRDAACGDPECQWCSERHDAKKELFRWFRFKEFRPEPEKDGQPLQQLIVEAAMRGRHVFAILPTGTGKSVCYQIPALSRYEKTGALTVVISPLVALMADQILGLESKGISCCAAINGLLSMPERADVLDRVRLGAVGILIIAPEQLRNRALRKVLEQREIGAWVLDEAHCLSKWGHDFRPDYRYVGRFIKEKAGGGQVPPVLCLTATAKPDVVEDIIGHFREKLGVELQLFDGGAKRTNLDFVVVRTAAEKKFSDIYQIIESDLPSGGAGGAIVYCASRKRTEEVAQFLSDKGLSAGFFHAGMSPTRKKDVQASFIRGELKVIVATNAFGMGIDKPDVRLVVHADIPGSLENYLQEAGRAGRDQAAARCVLLYTPEDVERQFGLSAHSRLNQREISAILRSLKNLDRKKRFGGEVVATAGEILAEEDEGAFARDTATDDTRVRTAISWLEEAVLLSREENRVMIFPSSLRVTTVDEARKKLETVNLVDEYRRQLLAIVQALMSADTDEGISTDELMGISGLSAEKVRSALYDLEKLNIASNDTALTAFVHVAVERSSQKLIEEAESLEVALIASLRENAPDVGKGELYPLSLRHAAQDLKDAGYQYALPERLRRILKSISNDGRGDDGGVGSLQIKSFGPEEVHVRLMREWRTLDRTALLRRKAADLLLKHLLNNLPNGARGLDQLAETTLGKLDACVEQDMFLKSQVKDVRKLVDRALLWLHEQEVIRLNKGLAVFRPAMTIRLEQEKGPFTKAHFAPLQLHYNEQIVQIHVMAEYVERGLHAMADALRLTMDYFSLGRDEFLHRWLPARNKELARQTTPASWRAIVESLNNPVQQRIVSDDREQSNVLVLAGPGSGKTRVLVHRIAYLLRVRRENPRGILALAYNRHAAVEIRRRLASLIGDDAKGVTVLTCHALAMRLAGVTFAGRAEKADENAFEQVLQQAIALLKGSGLPPEEADEQRDRLLSGFRWILVDEYQDIGPAQYELVSGLAGRTMQDEDRKLSLFAVGDDDQNIYSFAGASVEFIRRFESDYTAKAVFLTENYRSSRNIIAAANHVIASARDRMKVDNPISINRARLKSPEGGEWQRRDPVGHGRVQVLSVGNDALSQAVAVMMELERLSKLASDWNWATVAVIAREWKFLHSLRSYCEVKGIPVQMGDEEEAPNFWRLRETQLLIDWLHAKERKLITPPAVEEWIDQQRPGPWWSLLREALDQYALETGDIELPTGQFVEWLAEWGREVRRRQTGLLLLTAHRAKGLEFDHVVVLDGGWEKTSKNEDYDAVRRLYYVAMTRAKSTLALSRFNKEHVILDSLVQREAFLFREPSQLPPPERELARRYLRPTLREVDLGFSGRRGSSDSIHRAIAALNPGDVVHLVQNGDKWVIRDKRGTDVGQLAKSFAPPNRMHCISAHVAAIIQRRREDTTNANFQQYIRCDRWEVIVPELVFELAQ